MQPNTAAFIHLAINQHHFKYIMGKESWRLLLILFRKMAFDCDKRRVDKFNGEMLSKRHYFWMALYLQVCGTVSLICVFTLQYHFEKQTEGRARLTLVCSYASVLATESSTCVLILCCGILAGGRIAGAIPNIGNFLEFFFISSYVFFR